MKPNGETFKLISLLLQYPDRRFFERLGRLGAALDSLPAGRLKSGARQFLAHLQAQPAVRSRECYTAAFDIRPATTLNMTYHRWGDGEKRAAALARLQQIYLDAGYELDTDDLPDFLPLMLEFMAVCPEVCSNGFFLECLTGLTGLADRLRESAPAYARLLQLVGEEVQSRSRESEAPAADAGDTPGPLPLRPDS